VVFEERNSLAWTCPELFSLTPSTGGTGIPELPAGGKSDVIINVIDASLLSRSLELTWS